MAATGVSNTPLMSVGALLKESWVQTRRHMRTLVVLLLPLTIVMGLVQTFLDPVSPFVATGSALVGWLIVMVATVIWSFFAYVAMIQTLARDTEQLVARAAYQQSTRFVLPVVGVSFLAILISFVGFVLLIIPGIIWTTWYSFAPYVMVAEPDRVVTALAKSHQYVAGRFWAVVGRIVVLALVMGGGMLMAVIVALLLGFIPGLNDTTNLGSVLVMTVILSLTFLPIQLFGQVFHYRLYEALRASR